MQIAPAAILAVEVSAVLDVVQRRAVQIRTAAGYKRHGGADGLEHIGAGFARGDVH